MDKQQIKQKLEQSFISYVSLIMEFVTDETGKTKRIDIIKNYTQHIAKQFDIELDI